MSAADGRRTPTRSGAAELATRLVGDCGPVVGWIHGYTMDSSMFDDIWPALPGFRHVGIDLPGHGASPPITPQTTMTDIAAGVAAVLMRHDARLLVAVSLGSMAAFEVAIKRLCPLDGLAVVAPALVQLWMSAPPDIFAGLASHPERFAALRSVILRHRWRELDFGGPAAFYRDPQMAAALPGSARSLLVMSGDHDMAEFRDLAGRIATTAGRSARLLTVPGAGHLPLLEDPASTIGPLREFLTRAGQHPAGTGEGGARSHSAGRPGAAPPRTTAGTADPGTPGRPAALSH